MASSSSSSSSNSSSLPSPFSFAPSQYWDGNDGSWSSFFVRIGSPPQDFRVFPSTVGQETLVPLPEGCTDHDPSNCGSLRGVMPFQGTQDTGLKTNKSSTWDEIGLYTTNLGNNLGINVAGSYGFDTVGLQVENSGGIEQEHQVVAGIVDKSFMYGVLGLGPRPSNFSIFSDPKPSLLTSLSDNNIIPSKSYGYTAGAAYQYSKVLGSLTLGGYDASRFTTMSQISFPFASDDSRPLQVGITQIMATQTLQDTVTLSPQGFFAVVDSTVPHIWMPQTVCDQFARAFGLEYDQDTDFYTINDTIHDQLISLNPTVMFTISPTADYSSDRKNILLPYAAFDLEAGYPYYPKPTRYFPIRRAANDTQYTLGRTFLQEAYLIADYERNNFSIAQAAFYNRMPPQDIVSILPLSYDNNSTNSTTHPGGNNSTSTVAANNDPPILSRNVIIGIAVGAVGGAAIVLFIGAFWLYIRRRRRKQQQVSTTDPDPNDTFDRSIDTRSTQPLQPPNLNMNMELSGGSEVAINEMPAWSNKNEKWVGWRHEVHGDGIRGEMFSEPPELDGGAGVKRNGGGGVFELEGSEVQQQQQQQQQRQREEERNRFSFETFS